MNTTTSTTRDGTHGAAVLLSHRRMTYGEMPTEEQFDLAYEAVMGDEPFEFGNDKRVGNCHLTQSELWTELQKAHREYSEELAGDGSMDPERVGSWIADILGCLGFEWV